MGWVLLIGRVVFGGYFFYSGLNHFLQMKQMAAYAATHGVPAVMIPLTGALLLIGGLHVLLGVMPRFGLSLLVAFLIPVTLIMHAFWLVPDPQQRMSEVVNFTKNAALIGACFGIMAVPVPWPYSVDAWLRRRTGRRPSTPLGRPLPH